MQAWRWGRGGASSAPPPPAISFEAVCGHPPRGGLAQATQPPPTPASTLAPATTATTLPPTPQASAPTVIVTLTETGKPTAAISADTPAPPQIATVTITAHGTATATPAPSVVLSAGDSNSGRGGLVLFAGVAAAMVTAIGGALLWRRAHGR